MLLKEDFDRIEQWLQKRAVKDTQFPLVDSVDSDASIPVIYNNKNARILISAIGPHVIEGIPEATANNAGLMSAYDKAVINRVSEGGISFQESFYPEGETGEIMLGSNKGLAMTATATDIKYLYYRGEYGAGRIFVAGGQYITIPSATSSTAGLMGASERNLLYYMAKTNLMYGGDESTSPAFRVERDGYRYKLLYDTIKVSDDDRNSPVKTTKYLPIMEADDTYAGLMTSADKVKLDSISITSDGIDIDISDKLLSDSERYTLNVINEERLLGISDKHGTIPTVTGSSVTLNFVELDTAGGSKDSFEIEIEGATTSDAGVMTASDKKKLDNVDYTIKKDGLHITDMPLQSCMYVVMDTVQASSGSSYNMSASIPYATTEKAGLITAKDKDTLDKLSKATINGAASLVSSSTDIPVAAEDMPLGDWYNAYSSVKVSQGPLPVDGTTRVLYVLAQLVREVEDIKQTLGPHS